MCTKNLVIVKMPKKSGGSGRGEGCPVGGGGLQVGCVQRIEVIVKMPKKVGGGPVGGRGPVGGSGWM